MFPVLLRYLGIVLILFIFGLIVYRQWRKIELTEDRKNKIRDTLIILQEIEKDAIGLPTINGDKLAKARKKLVNLLKEGVRNGKIYK